MDYLVFFLQKTSKKSKDKILGIVTKTLPRPASALLHQMSLHQPQRLPSLLSFFICTERFARLFIDSQRIQQNAKIDNLSVNFWQCLR